ncbi:MAG: ABC transporter ATP-binding protein [Acidobacteria bacterium]|nr:ABC transporter ATP-binding protein [Acidobacteriota bacterium]MBI3654892.1 ABC transporter ATP-binding protein [Acidobacteriota bacterium]
MTIAIRCQDLRKRYDNKVDAVSGIDLEVGVSQCFGLLGPNGAGKTTTVEILEGLLEPTSGEVEVLGRRWREPGAHLRERLGITLQETRFSEKLTVRETLRLFKSFYRKSQDLTQVLDSVSLIDKATTLVAKLSGGQKQRLAVACALVGSPEILFLDEPTTGLDPQSRRQVWDIVRRFQTQGGTVLLTTHYMDEAERLCDQVAIVDHGKVIARGSPRALIHSLGGDHVVEFSVAANAAGELDQARMLAIPSAIQCRREGELHQLTVREAHVAIPALLELLRRDHYELSSLTTRHASLEDVFVNLTGRHLRDD